jgi:hypothetical protein
MKEMRDGRVHARMALMRDLFGLRSDETLTAWTEAIDAGPPAADLTPSAGAEVRQLHSRDHRRGVG